MSRNDERGVVTPAPLHFCNPASASQPRYDDDHRGPAVADSYELSQCWIDLVERSESWPASRQPPAGMIEYAETIPEDQRADWLRRQTNREDVDRLISQAMRTGDLPIWVAPIGEPERRVAPGALVEIDHATMVSGCYRPPNDRGWLFGRPLFVKRADWVRFASAIDRAKAPGTEAHRYRCAHVFDRRDPVIVSPWWSINQSLAWIVTRIPSFVEYIGNLEADEPREHRPYIVQAICESQVAESDEGKAFMATRRPGWPSGMFLAHAGRELLAKILANEIGPMVRENGQGRRMGAEEFVGIGASETGSDWLDLDPQPLFASAEIMRAFCPSDHGPAGGGGGVVPPNRQLDHAAIVARAKAMLTEQPGLSKGSAAASIRAELPCNPKTGKLRDQRGLERIIGHLWEGKVRQSPG